MNTATRKALFWTPRILTIAFALFMALFALDVFDEGYSIGGTIVALFMHLIPNFLILIFLFIVWRREWIGAIVFTGLGVFYLFATHGREHWAAYAFITGPLVLMGALFLLNWIYRRELRPPTREA